MQLFKPDYYVSDYGLVDSKWLAKYGFKYVFSDIDDTLVAHGETGEEDLDSWIDDLSKAGITLIGTSNNDGERAQEFRDRHGVEVVEKCHKPRTKVLERYIEENNIDRDKTIFLGDQLFVDVFCGNRLDITTVLVEPIHKSSPLSVKITWFFDWIYLRSLR